MTESQRRIAELSPEQRDLLLRRLSQAQKNHGPRADELVRRHGGSATEAPLSFAQERMWFLERLFPGNPIYSIAGALRLEGQLSEAALSSTLTEIYRRHETLRANFQDSSGSVIQTIAPPCAIPVEFTDLSALPAAERETERRRLYMEETRRGFNLSCDRLFRARLLRLAQTDHLLILAVHHIASDGWSIRILMEEFGELYRAYAESREPRLPEPPIRYRDFTAWQRERADAGAFDAGLAYWRKQLADPPTVLKLRPDRSHEAPHAPGAGELAGDTDLVRIGKELKSELENLSRREDTTLFVTMLAAFLTLLMRRLGQEDIVVGSPVSGRVRTQTERTVGLFVNTIALRAVLAREMTFRQAVALVRQTVLDGLVHHEVPFEKVVQDLEPERRANMHPIFETMFNFTPGRTRRLDLPGLVARLEAPPEIAAEFATQLYVTEWQGELELELLFPRAQYSHESMRCFLEQYQSILGQIVADSERTLGSLDLVTPGSRELVPDPRVPMEQPTYPPITEKIAHWIERTPSAAALRQGEICLTYADFGERVSALAAHLQGIGVGPGVVVGIYGHRCPGLIVAMTAVLFAGGVLLTLSPSLPEERRRVMLEESHCRLVLAVGDAKDQAEWLSTLGAVDIVPVEADGRTAGAADSTVAPVTPVPAYLFFTSGSTGKPKAVLGTHTGLSHFLDWQRETFRVGPGDRCGQLTGLSFDVVLRDVFLPLTSGATLVLPSEADTSSGDQTIRWLEREQISLIHTVPAVVDTWLLGVPPKDSLEALRLIFFAGEPLSSTLISRWRRAFPSAGEIVNLYGPTETTLAKCFYRVPAEVTQGIQPLGQAQPHVQALVLSPERNVCGIGEPGEIAIRTPFRSLGYSNAPEENERRFLVNPFTGDTADRIYLTGDRGVREADGLLHFLGRLDHQVKIRGVRVEPAEIAAVLKSSPDVAACAVVTRKDGADLMLVAYVVLQKGAGENAGRLQAYLRQRLPAAMVPAAFVFLESLPLTANQKVDHEKLPPPLGVRPNLENQFIPARDAMEIAIAQVWEDLLGVRPVGVTDNFFELGGHSLLALRLLIRIEQETGNKIPLAALFESPTVEHLAAVSRQRAEESRPIVLLARAQHPLNLFLVHPGGGTLLTYMPLVRHLASPMPVYGIQARGLDGRSDICDDLPAMASDYIREIRQIQPQGPYLLTGHSLGGAVAFEMARQLQEAGSGVALLAMLDSVLPGTQGDAARSDREEEDARRLQELVSVMERFLGRSVGVSFDRLQGMPADEQLESVVEALRQSDALPPGEGAEMIRNLLAVARAHVRASRSYRAKPSPVPITLIRARDAHASDCAPAVPADETLGWKAVSTEPVRVLWAPGDHVTMLADPHVARLAQTLRDCMEGAIEERAGGTQTA